MVCIAFGLCVHLCVTMYTVAKQLVFAVKVTIEDCYFILDWVETCPQKERPPRRLGVGNLCSEIHVG